MTTGCPEDTGDLSVTSPNLPEASMQKEGIITKARLNPLIEEMMRSTWKASLFLSRGKMLQKQIRA
jgi:hypothetical protein